MSNTKRQVDDNIVFLFDLKATVHRSRSKNDSGQNLTMISLFMAEQ